MNKIKRLSKEDACYIAGLFDGEGCVTISKSLRVKRKRRTYNYTLRTRIRMCDEAVIQWLFVKVGGRYYSERNQPNPEHSPYYEWGAAGKQAIEFLRQIYPYLKVKRLHAEIAFEYSKTIGEVVGYSTPEAVVVLREDLRRHMRDNNKCGSYLR